MAWHTQPDDRHLTDSDAAEIRWRNADGEGHRALAREFGVGRGTIRAICKGSTEVIDRSWPLRTQREDQLA